MITQLITDQLGELKLDVTTLAGMSFMVFLAIHFFVKIKSAIDSKKRIRRQVQRRIERDKANYIYNEKVKKEALKSGTKLVQNTSQRKNNGYYKKDKGYQAYLKRNSNHLANKQVIKHQRFKVVSSASKPSLNQKPSSIKSNA